MGYQKNWESKNLGQTNVLGQYKALGRQKINGQGSIISGNDFIVNTRI